MTYVNMALQVRYGGEPYSCHAHGINGSDGPIHTIYAGDLAVCEHAATSIGWAVVDACGLGARLDGARVVWDE